MDSVQKDRSIILGLTPTPNMNELFDDMFCDDTNMTHWLNAHCEYDDDSQFWFGRHYFDKGEFEYVNFEVIETPDDLFCITVQSHRGVDPFVTESAGEFLAFLDYTDWHSISISNIEFFLNDRYQVIPTNDEGRFVWLAQYQSHFDERQNFIREFQIELTDRHNEFIIHHGIAAIEPIRITTFLEMDDLVADHGLLDKAFKDEYFQTHPEELKLDELREWLNENFLLEPEESDWSGIHHDKDGQTSVYLNADEVDGGFLVTCEEFSDYLIPFLATSLDELELFMFKTDWRGLMWEKHN